MDGLNSAFIKRKSDEHATKILNNETNHLDRATNNEASGWIQSKFHHNVKPETKLLESKASHTYTALTDSAFVDPILYMNDVHKPDRPFTYLHRCQRCHQDAVRFEYIDAGLLLFLAKEHKRFARRKCTCDVCNASYTQVRKARQPNNRSTRFATCGQRPVCRPRRFTISGLSSILPRRAILQGMVGRV